MFLGLKPEARHIKCFTVVGLMRLVTIISEQLSVTPL